MKTVCRKLILAIFVAFLIWPMAASYSFATDQGTSSPFDDSANKMSDLSEDFSLDGLSAKATDGGSPLLGDECELGLSVSGNAGSVRYKFVWEQGGWSRWGSIRQGEPSASCSWTPEVTGDVNIWVDATDSAGRVTTRKFPVHVDTNLSNFTSISVEPSDRSVCAGDTGAITPNSFRRRFSTSII